MNGVPSGEDRLFIAYAPRSAPTILVAARVEHAEGTSDAKHVVRDVLDAYRAALSANQSMHAIAPGFFSRKRLRSFREIEESLQQALAGQVGGRPASPAETETAVVGRPGGLSFALAAER